MRFKSGLVAVALLATGCTAGDTAEDSMITVTEAIGDAQTTEIPVGLELLHGPPMDARRWEHEGLHCDATPERTTVEVCGQSFTSELKLAWSDCQVRPRMHRDHVAPQGTQEVSASGGGGGHGGQTPPSPRVSSGTVEVLSTITPVGECSESAQIQIEKQSTHDIRHASEDGSLVKLSGTVTATSTRGSSTGPQSRSSSFDTTRTRLDADGNTVESLRLTGELAVTSNRTAQPPTHTSQGTFTVTQADGSAATVTLTGIVRVPPPVCAWPISGMLQRTEADGTSHVLSFGPECGQATLDGEAITLPARPHGGRGPGGHRNEGGGARPPGGR